MPVDAPSVTASCITLHDANAKREWVVQVVLPVTSEEVTAAARAQHKDLSDRRWMYITEAGETDLFPGGDCVDVQLEPIMEPTPVD